jgi:hypothetical protein
MTDEFIFEDGEDEEAINDNHEQCDNVGEQDDDDQPQQEEVSGNEEVASAENVGQTIVSKDYALENRKDGDEDGHQQFHKVDKQNVDVLIRILT